MGDKTELSEKNVSIGIVGENQSFKIIENEEVAPYLAALEGDEKSEDVNMEG